MRLLTNTALKALLDEAEQEGFRKGWNKALAKAIAHFTYVEHGYRELPPEKPRLPNFIPGGGEKRWDGVL